MEFKNSKDFSDALMNGMVEDAPAAKKVAAAPIGDVDDNGMDIPIPSDEVLSSPHYFAGTKAVNRVAELEGRELSPIEKKVLAHEGYVDAVYLDTKGVRTFGVGQTGDFMSMPFSQVVERKEKVVRNAIEGYDVLPEEAQAELVQLAYRGDLKSSNKWVGLFNQGEYKEAAKELLDHKEYKDPSTSRGVKQRLEEASLVIASLQGNNLA